MEQDRVMRLEEAAFLADLSVRQLTREIERLGIEVVRMSPKRVGMRESEVARLKELRLR